MRPRPSACGGHPVERVPCHSAYRRNQHDAGKEWQVLQAVEMSTIETPHEATVIGNAEVPNGAPGSEMPEPHDRRGDDEGHDPDPERNKAPERDGHGM